MAQVTTYPRKSTNHTSRKITTCNYFINKFPIKAGVRDLGERKATPNSTLESSFLIRKTGDDDNLCKEVLLLFKVKLYFFAK